MFYGCQHRLFLNMFNINTYTSPNVLYFSSLLFFLFSCSFPLCFKIYVLIFLNIKADCVILAAASQTKYCFQILFSPVSDYSRLLLTTLLVRFGLVYEINTVLVIGMGRWPPAAANVF